MLFSTQCFNKNCGQIQSPYLDLQDNKVYCSSCDGELPNITNFIKLQMKSNKQFKQKRPEPFAVKCSKCNKEGRPVVIQDEVVCGSCKGSLNNLSPIFKNMLKEKLKTAAKDI